MDTVARLINELNHFLRLACETVGCVEASLHKPLSSAMYSGLLFYPLL